MIFKGVFIINWRDELKEQAKNEYISSKMTSKNAIVEFVKKEFNTLVEPIVEEVGDTAVVDISETNDIYSFSLLEKSLELETGDGNVIFFKKYKPKPLGNGNRKIKNERICEFVKEYQTGVFRDISNNSQKLDYNFMDYLFKEVFYEEETVSSNHS